MSRQACANRPQSSSFSRSRRALRASGKLDDCFRCALRLSSSVTEERQSTTVPKTSNVRALTAERGDIVPGDMVNFFLVWEIGFLHTCVMGWFFG